mmetsp:Transcript_18133/g.20498  ORF Transcript_18133/g.20498 Transcript_18133/m.20498 type:complete len:183 (-) Transcript_18133:1268-1816(-)
MFIIIWRLTFLHLICSFLFRVWRYLVGRSIETTIGEAPDSVCCYLVSLARQIGQGGAIGPFFVGSLLDAAISYMENFPMKVQVVFALVSDFLWMLNAILYTIGYIYGQDVRKRFANKYYTSLVHVEESDSDDEDEDENTTEPGMNKDQDEGVITEDSDSESLSNTDSNASEPLQSSIELSVI